jgi:hypothetical protein
MDLNFTQVTYDGELADFEAERLREIIREFENAQESNVAEFEDAADALDGVDEKIEDFAEARQALLDDITEAEAFDEVPLTEEALEEQSFGQLQEWHDFVADHGVETGDETDEADESGSDFDDFGTKSPTPDDEDDEDFAEDALSEMQGVNF